MKDYEKIRNFDYKKELNLSPLRKLLKLLNQPQNKFKSVHIAGTKGKTSTSYYLASLLKEGGVNKVGLYTSPHIQKINERFQINGEYISTKDLEKYSNYLDEIINKEELDVTYFDKMTALAFLYFADQKIDIAVIETGLGGRLDSTNVLSPNLCILTPIAKDHTHILGNNKFKIALEKLGILKKGVPFFLFKQSFSLNLFCKIIGKIKKAVLRKKLSVKIRKKTFWQTKLFFKDYKVQFEGPFYSIENFIVAFSSAIYLGAKLKSSFTFSHKVPARFEIVNINNSKVVLDGAHNPFSVKKLLESLRSLFNNKEVCFLFNAHLDKDIKSMLQLLEKEGVKKITILEHPDLANEKIIEYAKDLDLNCRICKIEQFNFERGKNYCVFGSFYLLGELKNALSKKM